MSNDPAWLNELLQKVAEHVLESKVCTLCHRPIRKVINYGTAETCWSHIHLEGPGSRWPEIQCHRPVPEGIDDKSNLSFREVTTRRYDVAHCKADGLVLPGIPLSGNGITGTSATTTSGLAPNPATAEQTVTFTATVAPPSTDTPAGSASFYDGSTLLGTVNIRSIPAAQEFRMRPAEWYER